MKRTSETELVRRLARLLGGAPAARAASVGIGDDAAVLRAFRGAPVWTVDVQVEGVHFRRPWLTYPELGARALHAAASDLAAMGARPIAALSGLVVPPDLGEAAVAGIARGQRAAARELGCPVVGGNLARGGELSVTTTVLGAAPKRPLTRGGARAGDEIWLVGDVGLAAAGLGLLSGAPDVRSLRARRRAKAAKAAITAFTKPRARIREGTALVGRASAAIDVSDGLATDVRRLAAASGVRAVLEAPALRAALPPALIRAARLLRAEPLELALDGGEDYALVATGPGRRRPPSAVPIGRIERGRGAFIEGVRGGLPVELGQELGFDHFA